MFVTAFEILVIGLFGLALAHGLHKYNRKRLLLAFTIFGILVTIEENCSMFLTDGYAYHGYYLWIWQLPLAITLAWITVCYLGFLVSTKINNVIVGCFLVSCLDAVLFEPAAYYLGLWTWHTHNYAVIRYFNAPIQNAIGWFLFILVGTLILKKLLDKPRDPNSASTRSSNWKWATALKHPNKFERAETLWQLGDKEPMDLNRLKMHFRLFNNEVEV